MSSLCEPLPEPIPPVTGALPHYLLVVEDDFASRSFLQIALVKQGYRVLVAEDAIEAQGQLQARGVGAFDCVLTDFYLPQGNGLELLLWIKRQDPGLATIMVTGSGERALVADSLRGGAVDFLDKPVEMDKLIQAVERAVRSTHRHRHMMEAESAVEILGQTQQRMLGADAPKGEVRVEICFHPKLEAGGDFFSQFQPSPDQYCALLTDVSGHDLQSAYISAFFHGYVRGKLENGAPFEKILSDFNRFLLEEMAQVNPTDSHPRGVVSSVAVCALGIDLLGRQVSVTNHGAPAPFYVLPDGRAQRLGCRGGFPLGWFAEEHVNLSTQSIAAGGSIWLWTDGLEDLADRNGVSAFSLAFALRQAQLKQQRLTGLNAAADDIMLAGLHLAQPPPQENFFPLVVESHLGNQAADIDQFQSCWRRSLALAAPELGESRMHDILLASREALINALEHGCGSRADEEASIQISYAPPLDRVRVRVSDYGPGHGFNFHHHEVLAADQLLEERRGLILMNHLATTLDFQRGGAQVIMDFA